jgi:hypothetical protein
MYSCAMEKFCPEQGSVASSCEYVNEILYFTEWGEGGGGGHPWISWGANAILLTFT